MGVLEIPQSTAPTRCWNAWPSGGNRDGRYSQKLGLNLDACMTRQARENMGCG